MSEMTKPLSAGPNGITAKAVNAAATLMAGEIRKTNLSAADGTMSSLSSSFNPSAIGCSNPHGPTRIGPSRACMNAKTLRSIKTR